MEFTRHGKPGWNSFTNEIANCYNLYWLFLSILNFIFFVSSLNVRFSISLCIVCCKSSESNKNLWNSAFFIILNFFVKLCSGNSRLLQLLRATDNIKLGILNHFTVHEVTLWNVRENQQFSNCDSFFFHSGLFFPPSLIITFGTIEVRTSSTAEFIYCPSQWKKVQVSESTETSSISTSA